MCKEPRVSRVAARTQVSQFEAGASGTTNSNSPRDKAIGTMSSKSSRRKRKVMPGVQDRRRVKRAVAKLDGEHAKGLFSAVDAHVGKLRRIFDGLRSDEYLRAFIFNRDFQEEFMDEAFDWDVFDKAWSLGLLNGMALSLNLTLRELIAETERRVGHSLLTYK